MCYIKIFGPVVTPVAWLDLASVYSALERKYTICSVPAQLLVNHAQRTTLRPISLHGGRKDPPFAVSTKQRSRIQFE